MNQLRKTTLGLAITAVIYGASATTAQAADVNINTSGTDQTIALGGDNHILNAVVTFNASGGATPALTTTGAGTVTNYGVITGTNAITHSTADNFTLSNSGRIQGAITKAAGALTFNNAGTYYGLITGAATTITNTDTLVAVGNSNLGTGDLDTSDGTVHVVMSRNGAAFHNGITTTGDITATANTVIKVSVDPSLLRDLDDAQVQAALGTLGTIGATKVLADGGNINNNNDYKVEAGNILLRITGVDRSDGLKVTLGLNDIEEVTQSLGLKAYAQKIAAKFQSGFTDADMQKIETAYGQLVQNLASTEELKAYLLKILPDDSDAAANSGVEIAHAVSGNISNRTSSVRTGIAAGGLTEVDNFWVQALYAESRQRSDGISQAYTGRVKGATFGVDRKYGDITAGIAFSYGRGTTHFSNRAQEEKLDSYMGSLYGVWQQNDYYIDGSLSYGLTAHESRQNVGTVAAETAEYDSIQVGAKVAAGYYIIPITLSKFPIALAI